MKKKALIPYTILVGGVRLIPKGTKVWDANNQPDELLIDVPMGVFIEFGFRIRERN